MKKRNVLQIALAAGIVATGVFAGGKDGEAAYHFSSGAEHALFNKNQSIPEGFPKNVKELRERMTQTWEKVKVKHGGKNATKVVVITSGGGQYTVELDSTYKTHRDPDLLDGIPMILTYTTGDGKEVKLKSNVKKK